MNRRKAILSACAAAAVAGSPLRGWAAEDLRIIVANPPGGQTDLFARAIAQGIQSRAGQVVVVENRPGAGGIIGVQGLLSAPADGKTMLLTTLASLIAPVLQKNRNIDVLGSTEPVSLLASGGSLVLVNEKVAATDLASFIRLAKQQPGRLTYASGGSGSSAHLITEYMKSQLGIDLVHVPYKGGVPAAMAIRTGEVDLTIIDEANAAPLINDGKVRVVAQTGLRRLASHPTLARVADVAPGFDASFWMGLSVRKGAPRAQVDRLHGLIADILQKDLQELIKRSGLSQGIGSRADFGSFMATEQKKWTQVIRANSITSN